MNSDFYQPLTYVWSEPPGEEVLNLKFPDLMGFLFIWGLTRTNTSALHILHCLFTIFKLRGRGDETTLACASIHWKQNGQKTKKHLCHFPACFTLCRRSYGTDSDSWLQKRNSKHRLCLDVFPEVETCFRMFFAKRSHDKNPRAKLLSVQGR